ncbi:MAG: hypothetical protein IJ551_10365 [Prevotella sp.]|nr:hypothetical protein [Prevotella sp.]MBQ8713203.1 hypothetical protein [Prevotella sp.]
MKKIRLLYTLLFGLAVLLFFGLAYPHHLHYQEQFQLFLFDGNYVWDIVRHPGGMADLLGRFCTQFFLFAWVGAAVIAVLLSAVQLLMTRLTWWGWLYGLTFVPSFLLWIFLLDENALMGGIWAVLLTLIALWGLSRLPKGWIRRILIIIAIPILYWMVGPAWDGTHYHRYPTVVPVLLYAAWLSAIILPFLVSLFCKRKTPPQVSIVHCQLSILFVFLVMGSQVCKNSNLKAEKVMKYDFMARYQQWNRILETINAEKPNNQIGVTVQNLALAMHGMLADHLFDYHQNGLLGLLPDVGTDATSPLPTAEAFYQLGMITVAQRTVFEAQEAILDFQKSGRCYKRLAQTYLILGNYEVARKYLMALQKTLFYRSWANETLPLLGDEEAIAQHPEYGRLRQCAYQEDFFFGDHVTADMLEKLYFSNTDNRLALEYLKAYYMLTGDREGYASFLQKAVQKQ